MGLHRLDVPFLFSASVFLTDALTTGGWVNTVCWPPPASLYVGLLTSYTHTRMPRYSHTGLGVLIPPGTLDGPILYT